MTPSMTLGIVLIALALSYLVGSLSSAILVCRLMGFPDPRTQGSHNPGATNVLRFAGKLPAALTLFGDALKGFLPVLIAKALALPSPVVAIAAFGAVLGHMFPIFFHFKGGKGVATLLGTLIALSWPTALCWGLVWLLIAMVTRYSSLAALIATFVSLFFIIYFTHNLFYLFAMFLICFVIVLRHLKNIERILGGTESKIGRK